MSFEDWNKKNIKLKKTNKSKQYKDLSFYYLFGISKKELLIIIIISINTKYVVQLTSRRFHKEKLTQICWQYAHLHFLKKIITKIIFLKK